MWSGAQAVQLLASNHSLPAELAGSACMARLITPTRTQEARLQLTFGVGRLFGATHFWDGRLGTEIRAGMLTGLVAA